MKLNFKIYGEGFPILIMHGLLGSLDNWQSVAKSLAEENMVITIDLRNHGRSMHSPVFNYQAMVYDYQVIVNFVYYNVGSTIY